MTLVRSGRIKPEKRRFQTTCNSSRDCTAVSIHALLGLGLKGRGSPVEIPREYSAGPCPRTLTLTRREGGGNECMKKPSQLFLGKSDQIRSNLASSSLLLFFFFFKNKKQDFKSSVFTYISPHCEITTSSLGLLFGPHCTFSTFLTTRSPSPRTLPKTTCLSSSQSHLPQVMKN